MQLINKFLIIADYLLYLIFTKHLNNYSSFQNMALKIFCEIRIAGNYLKKIIEKSEYSGVYILLILMKFLINPNF